MNKELNRPRKVLIERKNESPGATFDEEEQFLFHHWIRPGVALVEHEDSGHLKEIDFQETKGFTFLEDLDKDEAKSEEY